MDIRLIEGWGGRRSFVRKNTRILNDLSVMAIENPGYGLCYPGGRRSGDFRPSADPFMTDSPAAATPPRDSTWLSWGRSVSAVTLVVVLLALGVANIGLRSRWHEAEDGVLWGARAEGVTAIEVADGSAGAAAGVEGGAVLLAGNGLLG